MFQCSDHEEVHRIVIELQGCMERRLGITFLCNHDVLKHCV
jgi:hypothetical protein